MSSDLVPAAGHATPGKDPAGASGTAASAAPRIDRGLRIRRLRLLGPAEPFEVSFVDDPDDEPVDVVDGEAQAGVLVPGQPWPLSVIAGRTNTGKTSVLRFIEYVLGSKHFPAHTEVLRQVRSAALEVDTPDGVFTLERALDTNRVYLYPGVVGSIDPLKATTLLVEPTGDPESVSQFALATVGLQDVDLKEAPTKDESGTDRMSFRDLMWVCLYLNERVGSQQLLHAGNVMKSLKLRQVVDAVFGVHDNLQADLARRVKDAAAALEVQRRSLEHLSEFVDQQQPKSAGHLASEADVLDADLRDVQAAMAQLEERERAASDFASEMRAFHAGLAARASLTDALVRDRVSLLDRFGSLRAQYADDVRKLTMLVEAETLFDQLSVEVCPACFSTLTQTPQLVDGVCSLCHNDTTVAGDIHPETGQPETDRSEIAGDASDDVDDMGAAAAVQAAARELRAAKQRYRELDEYWQRLSSELAALRVTAREAAAAESDASSRLDATTKDALSPFLGQRSELGVRRQAILVQRSQVTQGIKLHTGLEARQAAFARAQRSLDALRAEQREAKQRPDRARVIAELSARYAQILRHIEYPKVDEDGTLSPYIDDNLVPYVRGQHFKEASSGGQVLVSLAWMLAIFEVAYETDAGHPGFLMIDTPQKNLGGKADDAEFADIHLVERVYEHLLGWLEGPGEGAQVIIVDNTPPEVAESHVRVRYTRDPDDPPFGLIANEVGPVALAPGEEDLPPE